MTMNPRLAIWLVNGLLAALAASALFPLLWMLSVSFMAWLRGKGLAIRDLRTPWGRLSWNARVGADGAIDVRVSGLHSFPRGGVILRGPWGREGRVAIDGRKVDGPAGAIFLSRLPAHVRVEPR